MTVNEILQNAPGDKLIIDSLVLTHAKLQRYDKILCSISGGSDSDILLDLCQRCNEKGNVTFAFFDTGLEFVATKEHLRTLEEKYNVDIQVIRAIKPIPVCCREYGQPFLSKQVSEWIERLQRHNFQWEDEPLDVLLQRYPKCRAALRWWCNDFEKKSGERESSFNINYNQYLKKFMVNNPPTFRISNKCCHYAKKKVAQKFKVEEKFDLNIYGVRKSEGGARKSAYKNCFSTNEESADEFRPIFWYLAETKKKYETHYAIEHSRCYSEYGLKRTGCAGCPYGRNFEEELEAMQVHEPKLFNAVNNVFAESYEYTRKYRNFVREMRNNIKGEYNDGD